MICLKKISALEMNAKEIKETQGGAFFGGIGILSVSVALTYLAGTFELWRQAINVSSTHGNK